MQKKKTNYELLSSFIFYKVKPVRFWQVQTKYFSTVVPFFFLDCTPLIGFGF